jgi:hypothetical protein
MPDLITHFAAAYVIKAPKRWARFRIPFYIGALLPDLLTRPLHIVFPSLGKTIYSLHTPISVVLICLLAAQFFQKDIRAGVRSNLLLGSFLHFGLDLLQKTVITAYYWFFPFSWKTFDFGILWPSEFLQLVPLWILLVAAMEIVARFQKRKSLIRADFD